MCIPLSTLENNRVQYNTCHMGAFIHSSFCNVGAKSMFCHPLSPSSLSNNYTAVNLVFKQKENCQLSSQIRQSLPYHSRVAKRCWACPRVVIFLCNEWLDLDRSQLCGKNRQPNRAALPLLSAHGFAGTTEPNKPIWL